jgi:hypothetical protein
MYNIAENFSVSFLCLNSLRGILIDENVHNCQTKIESETFQVNLATRKIKSLFN